MNTSLLDLVFGQFHMIPKPVLWHTDCAIFPDELDDLLAKGVLTRTSDAERLPAARLPAVGSDLGVQHYADGRIIGTAWDGESERSVPIPASLILRYAINIQALVRQLRDVSGLDGVGTGRFVAGLMPIGELHDPAGTIHVYLAAPVPSGKSLLDRCRRLHALHSDNRSALLTFCRVAFDVPQAEELRAWPTLSVLPLRDAKNRPCWSPIWPAASEPPPAAGLPECAFLNDGKIWRIHFCGAQTNVDDSIGMHYIALMADKPAEQWTPFELQYGRRASEAGTSRAVAEGLRITRQHQSDLAVVDAKAVREMLAKRDRLQIAQDEAKAQGRDAEAAEAGDELAAIETRLDRDLGKAGQIKFAGEAKKAAQAVRANIKRALKAIADENQAIGRAIRERLTHTTPLSFSPQRGEQWQVRFPKKIKTSRPKSQK